jgi:hypothetical protein
VIKADPRPLVLVVAAFALGAVPPGVDILNLVAIDTRNADSLVAFANMACGAGDIAVCALERESGPVVVERFYATPCRLSVTIVAPFAKTALVRIVRLVTLEAASGCLAELCRLRVTADALHGLVSSSELETRKSVIECLAVELDDVGISPLVIGVTMGAFLFCCIRLTPMKSLDQLTIGGNFFVARQAEPRLRFS